MNNPLKVFKLHVDLTETYGEFFVSLMEDIIVPYVSRQEQSATLDDYSSMGPQMFGDLVRCVFSPKSVVIQQVQHVVGLTGLRRYFPSDLQGEGGVAQLFLERIYAAICSQVARSEIAAKQTLLNEFMVRPVDIIYTDHPQPYIHVDGESSYVMVYGEVWEKEVPQQQYAEDDTPVADQAWPEFEVDEDGLPSPRAMDDQALVKATEMYHSLVLDDLEARIKSGQLSQEQPAPALGQLPTRF